MVIKSYYIRYRALFVCSQSRAKTFGRERAQRNPGLDAACRLVPCCVYYHSCTIHGCAGAGQKEQDDAGLFEFICWEQKATTSSSGSVRVQSLVEEKKSESARQQLVRRAPKAHAIGVPQDARKSNTLITHRGSGSCPAASRGPSCRVSATLTHEVIDDFFLSRRPDPFLPSLFSLSSSALSASFARTSTLYAAAIARGSIAQPVCCHARGAFDELVGFRSMHGMELISPKRRFSQGVGIKNQDLKKKNGNQPVPAAVPAAVRQQPCQQLMMLCV